MPESTKWFDSNDPERFARGAGWFGLKWSTVIIVSILVASALIGAATWGLRVATSDAKGRGDTIIRENSANNRISAQAFFEDAYQNIKATDQKISDANQALDDFQQTPRPEGNMVAATQYDQQLQQLRNELRGLQSNCRDTVARYNAEARKTIRDDWRADDLPYQIDGTDSATDCQPSSR